MSDKYLEAAAKAWSLASSQSDYDSYPEVEKRQCEREALRIVEAWVGDRELYEVKNAIQAPVFDKWVRDLEAMDILVRVSVEGNEE